MVDMDNIFHWWRSSKDLHFDYERFTWKLPNYMTIKILKKCLAKYLYEHKFS